MEIGLRYRDNVREGRAKSGDFTVEGDSEEGKLVRSTTDELQYIDSGERLRHSQGDISDGEG